MNGPLQTFCLAALFNLFLSMFVHLDLKWNCNHLRDANTVAGAVDIKEVAGVYSKEDEISKLWITSLSPLIFDPI